MARTVSFHLQGDLFTAAPAQVKKALQLAKPRGKAVLDLCCGAGRCSVPLARRGLRVTGVDRSPYSLEQGAEPRPECGCRMEWVHADMRDVVRPNTFDVMLSMYRSFGYFNDKQEDVAVLTNESPVRLSAGISQ